MNINAPITDAAWHDPVTFTISHWVDAPVDLVWQAHTEKQRLAAWWGPKGLEWLDGTLDFKPGGHFHYGMRAPHGPEMWGMFHYLDITPPRRIVFLNHFSDKAGGLTRHPFSPAWPLQVLNELSFAEKDGGTQITLRGVPFEAAADERQTFLDGHKSMQGGFSATFVQLDAYLAVQK